jgi:hypothetical protein
MAKVLGHTGTCIPSDDEIALSPRQTPSREGDGSSATQCRIPVHSVSQRLCAEASGHSLVFESPRNPVGTGDSSHWAASARLLVLSFRSTSGTLQGSRAKQQAREWPSTK